MLVIAAGAALDRLGAVIAAVHAEEFFAFAIEAGDGAADLRHPPPAGLVVVGEVAGILRKAFAGGGEDGAVLPDGVGDVLGVLEVEGILREVPLGGELAVGEHAQLAGLGAGVGDLEVPVFEVLIERHEVGGGGLDAAVLALDYGVAGAEARGGLVLLEGLADGLPRGRPVVAAGLVAQVELAARHVHRDGVVAVAQEAAGGRRAGEAVATGVVGDDGAIAAVAEIVGPRPGSVGAGDDIFAGCVVEVTVVHCRV